MDGLFFAAQTCSYDKTDRDTFLEYGKPYDIKVLEAANNMWFNVIHAHGNNIMMDIKGISGLLDKIKSGEVKPKSNIVFVHTGGHPALFATKDFIDVFEKEVR